ncbi:MAG: right-handed parallel beta-helix repeat-containing protein [Planctomycetota bacterium]
MRRTNYILLTAVMLGFASGLAQARTITVGPGGGYDYSDIQAAVDDANTGDTVLVAPAEYVITESIWVEGKAVTLRSQAGPEVTTIRISPTDPNRRNVVTLWRHGTDGSVVDGFTMTGGEGWYNPAYGLYGGGGILCYVCAVTIANCRITGSSAYTGAGILLWDGDLTTITNCTMWDNTASHDGGGMTFNGSDDVTVSNCTVLGNSAAWGGGGVCVWESSATITNCTVFGNSASSYGGAVGIGWSSATITNSILWGNSAPTASQVDLAGVLNLSYSDVEYGQDEVHQWPGSTLNWGPGNIDADPYFADADNSDFHLKSEIGRWDPCSETWVRDDVTSPCIDGGDPNSDCSAEPSPHGSRINMGAFGDTTEASKSRLRAYNPSPANGATDVSPNVVLCWSPRVAATSHDVYFGTGFDDVNNATTSSAEYKGRQDPDANSYDPPEELELVRTYYWRIDEFDDPCVSKGNVWSFTTADYVAVDDMESYDEVNLYDMWKDGYANGSGSAIWLATAPAEPVHSGRQSLGYLYDNSGMGMGVPYYSEAYRPTEDPCDWTIFGVKTLTLWFYGDPGNSATDAERMYAGLEDKRGAVSYAELRYGDHGEDMNDIKIAEWQRWNIELQDFNDSGVNVEDVNRLYIGFGNRVAPVLGDWGTVYFDDIRLHLPAITYPECWGYPTQCHGDCDNTGDVKGSDFLALKKSWYKVYGDDAYDPCADFDRNGEVKGSDFLILKNNWYKTVDPNCLPGGTWPP